VPVLLKEGVQAQIRQLVDTRAADGIIQTNKFLLARPESVHPYRGSDCLNEFSKQCGAKNVEPLTTRGLRRQIATISQVLALRWNEMDLHATFLGHNVHVHREFYRLPQETLHVARVAKLSKLLLALEKIAR